MIESLEAISISVPILSSCWPSDDDFCVRELWQFPEDFSNDLRPHASRCVVLTATIVKDSLVLEGAKSRRCVRSHIAI